jgi:hypothetical protein
MPISFLLDADSSKLEQSMAHAKDVIAQQTAGMVQSVSAVRSSIEQVLGGVGQSFTSLPIFADISQQLDGLGVTAQHASSTVQTYIGAMLIGLRGFSIGEFVTNVVNANHELAGLATTAGRLGLTTDQIQELAYAMKTMGGLDSTAGLKNALDFFQKINAEYHELSNGGGAGNITKLFQANGLSIEDQNGKLKSFNELLADASRLIAAAGSEVDQLQIAKILGLSQEWIAVLGKGPAALKRAEDAAKAAGAVVDTELIHKASEFDEWWSRSLDGLTAHAKASAVQIGGYLKQYVMNNNDANNWIGTSFFGQNDLGVLQSQMDDLKKRRDKIYGDVGSDQATIFDNSISTLTKRIADAEEAARGLLAAKMATGTQSETAVRPGTDQGVYGALVGRPTDSSALTIRGHKTNIPSFKNDTGTETADEVDRYTDQLRKQVEVLKAQVSVEGLGNAERVKAVDLAKAEEAARVRGTALTDDERKAIQGLAQDHADLTKKLEDFKKAQRAVADATNFFGQQVVDVFDQMIFQGAKASDVFRNLAEMVVKASLQAQLLGSGPLAGIFGTSGQNGNVGGLFGSLTSGFSGLFGGSSFSDPGGGSVFNPIAGARAGGGPVSAGQTYLVGEKGPELLRMASDGVVIPNAALGGGDGGVSIVVNNNAPGAKVQTQASRGPDGRQQVQIMVAEALTKDFDQRGPVSRMLEKRGLRR